MISVHNKPFQLLLSESVIQARVQELAQRISTDYQFRKPHFITMLNGAFIFAADLLRACDLQATISFTRLASYEGLFPSDKITTVIGITENLEDKDIIIIEDIIDTGRTLHFFMQGLEQYKPASVAVATLLVKPKMLTYSTNIHYCGFEIPDEFVIGYGLDYDGLGRNLRGIYQNFSYK